MKALPLLLWCGAALAQNQVTINGVPQTSSTVTITTSVAPPPPLPPPLPAPPVPPAGCVVLDAPTQLGGNPPISPTPSGATQVLAFKIAADLLDNKSVGAYQPSTGLTVAISNQPCDIGSGVTTNYGCYNTLPPNNPTQVLIRVGATDGYLSCKKPPPNNGYLYVNFAWTGYQNYGQPLTNFCIARGLATCYLQFRRDS
jgi:hypothetical protein